MRKIILVIIFVLSFTTTVYAQLYQNYLGPSLYHRINVTSDDSSNPTSTTDSFDCSGYSHVRVYCDISGSNPSWDVTPLYYEPSGERYYEGTTTTVTEDGVYILETDTEPYLYMKLDSSSGTNPAMTILLQGVTK